MSISFFVIIFPKNFNLYLAVVWSGGSKKEFAGQVVAEYSAMT
jgi:hypothetical protein